ncbi:hypothetical protein D3C87_1833600 [compost metagenome]
MRFIRELQWQRAPHRQVQSVAANFGCISGTLIAQANAGISARSGWIDNRNGDEPRFNARSFGYRNRVGVLPGSSRNLYCWVLLC